MKKENELISIEYVRGFICASLYNLNGNNFHEIRFSGYTKKEIASKLRHDYSCIVRRGQL